MAADPKRVTPDHLKVLRELLDAARDGLLTEYVWPITRRGILGTDELTKRIVDALEAIRKEVRRGR